MKKYLLLLGMLLGFSCLGAATLTVDNRSSTRQAYNCFITVYGDDNTSSYSIAAGPGQKSFTNAIFYSGKSIHINFLRSDDYGRLQEGGGASSCYPGEYFSFAYVTIFEDSVEFTVSQLFGLNPRTVKVPFPDCYSVKWVNGNWIQSLR